jgi:calcineurin-like phosphoesterase family protein
MTVWFTSDQHFYHTNVIRYSGRPFKTVEEMNEEIIKRWNSVVKRGDFVFCLGDFSLALRPVELFTRRLNGHKILTPGNHDHVHPAHYKKRLERRDRLLKQYNEWGWAKINPWDGDGLLTIADQKVRMTHMPYRDINYEEQRYRQYRFEDDGKWLLHGHVHEQWTINKKMINVGVDVWNFYPVSLDSIKQIIKNNPDGVDNTVPQVV